MTIQVGVTAVTADISGTTATTPARATQTGDTVVAIVTWSSTENFVSITDNAGNTDWKLAVAELTTGAGSDARMYYHMNVVGNSAHTFTLTISASNAKTIWIMTLKQALAFLEAVRLEDLATPFSSGSLDVKGPAGLVGACLSLAAGNPNVTTFTDGSSKDTATEVTDSDTFWAGAQSFRRVADNGSYSTDFTMSIATAASAWIMAFLEKPPSMFMAVKSALDVVLGAGFKSKVTSIKSWF